MMSPKDVPSMAPGWLPWVPVATHSTYRHSAPVHILGDTDTVSFKWGPEQDRDSQEMKPAVHAALALRPGR